MTDENAPRRRLNAPRSTAALIGLGAALAGSVQAAPAHDRTAAAAEVVLRVEDGRLFLSQGGQDLGEVALSDTAGSAALRALLSRVDASELRGLQPLVVADGAGGSSWLRPPPASDASNHPVVNKTAADAEAAPKPGNGHASKADVKETAPRKANE